MNPAQTLTAAAHKLRAAATADYVQPGPWIVHEAYGFLRVDNDRDKTREAWTVKSGADLAENNRNTAEYIALMHPGVALAVADWLESVANGLDVGLEYCGTHGDDHPCRCIAEPFMVAQQILGEVAE